MIAVDKLSSNRGKILQFPVGSGMSIVLAC